jgi:hypothetical protein
LGQEKIKSKNTYSKARGRIIAGYILYREIIRKIKMSVIKEELKRKIGGWNCWQ